MYSHEMVEAPTAVAALAEIEWHHGHAHQHAESAVEHARAAGRLLLQAKAALPHGEFLNWLAANVTFSARTASRYMNAAAPKPKSDRVSFSGRRPRAVPAAAALRIAACDRVRHRDDVLAHAVFLIGALPSAESLRDEDLDSLRALRARIDETLGTAR